MNDTTPDLLDPARRTALAIAGALVVGGAGCATAMALQGGTKTTIRREGPVVLNDTIVALGRPDAALARQIDQSDAVVFFGQAHTYLLVEGGATLEQIARRLPSDRLTLVADSHALYLQERTVWGQLQLRYTVLANSAISDEQKRTLNELGFSAQADGNYQASIAVKGAVHPALAVPPQAQALQRSRALVFRAPPVTELRPDLSKAISVPLAIAVDIVTAPVQLLGFAVLLIVIGTAK